jgi:hypothetical protein
VRRRYRPTARSRARIGAFGLVPHARGRGFRALDRFDEARAGDAAGFNDG